MDINKYKLFEFKLNRMVKNPAIVLIGKRGTGKSFITRDIIYHLRHIPGGICIAKTDKLNPFYSFFFPDLYIHYEVDDIIFKKIIKRQNLMKIKMKTKEKEGKKIDPSILFVMDDCLADNKKWAQNPHIRNILMNGRHYQITYILTMQYVYGIYPDLRSQFDYIFLLKEDSTLILKKLWDNYAGIFKTLSMFERFFKICTTDNNCMVIDNRKPGDTIQDKIYWFKAQHRKFMFGSNEFYMMHKKYYDPDYQTKKIFEDDEELFCLKGKEGKLKIEKI